MAIITKELALAIVRKLGAEIENRIWLGSQDSNLEHPAPKAGVLPIAPLPNRGVIHLGKNRTVVKGVALS